MSKRADENWWRHIFDDLYLLTDARSVCDEELTRLEVDFLVEAVRTRGTECGLYGAKITGGGSGGTVAVFGSKEAIAREMPVIAREYRRLTGLDPDIFEGTSPGAVEFGAFRYAFGSTGWTRSI